MEALVPEEPVTNEAHIPVTKVEDPVLPVTIRPRITCDRHGLPATVMMDYLRP